MPNYRQKNRKKHNKNRQKNNEKQNKTADEQQKTVDVKEKVEETRISKSADNVERSHDTNKQNDTIPQEEAATESVTKTLHSANMGTKQSKDININSTTTTTTSATEEFGSPQPLETRTQQVKLIIHRIIQEPTETNIEIPNDVDATTNNKDNSQNIVTELKEFKSEQSNNNHDVQEPEENEIVKESTLSIQEVSSIINETQEPLINEVDSESEPETETETETQNKSSDYEEIKQKRAQKRAALETHFLPQLLSPRYLDSILEENSDVSDARSDCSDVRRTSIDLEALAKKANAKFPHSNLDFSKTHKHGDLPNPLPTLPGTICEEPLTVTVEAKYIEQLSNLCNDETDCTQLPQIEAAELVYINSSTSSSVSDLSDEETNNDLPLTAHNIDLDTDVQSIMIKPIDEIVNEPQREREREYERERECTPVNQTINEHLINKHEVVHESKAQNESAVTADLLSDLNNSSSSCISITDDASFASLENTCREIMDSVREIVYANMPNESIIVEKSPSPPPLPPPPTNLHANYTNTSEKNNTIDTLERQESLDSHCSGSTNHSQCTAINLAETEVENTTITSPVVTDYEDTINGINNGFENIQKLRALCTKKLASLPYGEQVLEELATVAQNIAEANNVVKQTNLMDLQSNLTKISPPREIVHKVHFSYDIHNEQEKLRKEDIPPAIPPPPVPIKSSETAAKAHRTITANNNADDISIKNVTTAISTAATATATTTFTNLANNIKTTSSLENNSRPTAANLPQLNDKNHNTQTYTNHSEVKVQTSYNKREMQSVESELERMFPKLGNSNIFDKAQKRFSNIEESTNNHWAKEQLPKRYSNIETYTQKEDKKEREHVEKEHILSSLPEEKLFNDIEALSKELNQELETGRMQRAEREKSASLFDVRHMHMKEQSEELKRHRHAHMQELEKEIERSMRNRHIKTEMSVPSNTQKETKIPFTVDANYERPKKTESTAKNIPFSVDPNYAAPQRAKSRERIIPFTVEANNSQPSTHFEHDQNSPFRRTESLCDLGAQRPYAEHNARPATASSHYTTQTDDWSQYASDFGNSENIARPFAKEMEICYQRQQPRTIRAPRLSVSNQDLSSNYAPTTYDSYNAYNVQRSHAPLLQQTPPKRQPSHYGSCYSVLERDPNPTYISTTSRRGVSPAPPPTPVTPTERTAFRATQSQARRASLPREIHEQQLKYINSKEEELRTEFERLQNERKRLLEQLAAEETTETQPPTSPAYAPRAAHRLPTLSEDEVFRNQMAEEWLNKVAEREERRLQKIIKISKMHEQQQQQEQSKSDISQEFLKRVHERRDKLHMPADSDWESGAESQPIQTTENATHEIPIKVVSGRSLADVTELPQHLKEFARYTNEETENLANGLERHIKSHEEHSRDVTDNSSSTADKKSTVVKTIKIARMPPQLSAPGKGECTNIQAPITQIEDTNNNIPNHAQLACNTNNSLTDTKPDSSGQTGSYIVGSLVSLGLGLLGAWVRLT